MAGVVTTKLLEALAEIGVDVSKKQPSNVKTLATKNKSSATKVGLLAAERDTGGNFGTVLDIFKKEAQFIDGMNDVEQMAFLNNIMDYKEFGGKSIKVSEGIKLKDEFDKGLGTLTDDIESLQTTAKSMKDEAEAGLASAEKDLKDFLDTGGQPLKAKSDKYLGGSMHEEGQLRTAIRTFLRNEYKNGRIKLDKDDQFRVMEYSPMMEDDPIKVFKKIYGDEAYTKAGTFPGAFEKGENFNHYEQIFKENMGEDLLKVKDKKYVGDGKLVLTKQEEVLEPTPDVDDDDVPFAKGGRASFVGGKVVDELVAMIVKKEPMDAMKEVNKIIGKKGKYKNLTQKDIDRIVDQTNDHIFQRDPDNLFVGDRDINKSVDEMSVEDSLTTLEGLGATKMAERFKLKQRYPGISEDLLTNIIEDTDPVHRASVLAKMDQAMKLIVGEGKGTDEAIDILKSEPKTKMATGGRAGYYGGGQAMVEPDLSDIGHGSDALMGRTRLTAPGSQATTSTGLNYLLGEDNDNIRVPFNEGLLVPPKKPYVEKPYTTEMFEDDSMTFLKGMYGTGPDSNEFLYNEMIKKGNMLRKQGVDRETVIEIIRKNKDKIDMILKQQTGDKKSLAGLADGGRIGYATKGKVSLSDLESLKGLKKARGENETGIGGIRGIRGLGLQSAARKQREKILDKAIAKFTYVYDNLDQESKKKEFKKSYEKALVKATATLGYETTMSGLKMDAAEKVGIVPIDKETIYSAIINMDLPKELKLEATAIGDAAGSEELSFSLSNNNLGITYDNKSQTIVGKYQFNSKDGKTSITPSITKDQDSQIKSRIEFDKAFDGGQIDLDFTDDTTDNSLTTDFSLVKDGNVLTAQNVSGTDNDYFKAEGTAEVPLYMLKGDLFKNDKGKYEYETISPYFSTEYLNKGGSNSLTSSIGLPFNKNLEASLSNIYDSDGTNINRLGIDYKKSINNFFTKNKTLDNRGIFSSSFNMDDQGEKNAMFEIKFPLGGNTTDNIGNMNFDDMYLSRDEKERRERKKLENTMFYNGNEYRKKNIYSGNELSGLIEGTTDNFKVSDFIGPKQQLASGGIAGLRQGYVGGGGVNLARRGFLKFLGGTAAGVAALKTGLVKMFGKESGAISKKAIDEVIIDGGSGAPAWLQPLVNKALREGKDISQNAIVDGQVVKSLDTPTGKVDVYYDTRTGEIDIDYIGGNTALGESVNMRYVPGVADEGTKGVKPMDEFEASEAIPEGQMSSPNDYNVELGENVTGDVKELYSDTSELAELGGEKLLIKDISTTIKKKKVLKQMNENPDKFASDNLRDDFPDYDYGDVNPDYD